MLHTTKKRFANIGKPYAHHKGTFVDISKGAKIGFGDIYKPDAHHKKPLCLISDEPITTARHTGTETQHQHRHAVYLVCDRFNIWFSCYWFSCSYI